MAPYAKPRNGHTTILATGLTFFIVTGAVMHLSADFLRRLEVTAVIAYAMCLLITSYHFFTCPQIWSGRRSKAATEDAHAKDAHDAAWDR